jgi:hypothetical protein
MIKRQKEDENIILQEKTWGSIKTRFQYGLTYLRLYLTDKRIYGKSFLIPIKLFDSPFSDIQEIGMKGNRLRIKWSKGKISVYLKKPMMWEHEIKNRIISQKNLLSSQQNMC